MNGYDGLALALAGVIGAGVCGGQGSASSSQSPGRAPAPVLGRSTVDRPDEAAGNQVHVMYVLPADGTDRTFDSDGTINAAMQLAQNWFAGQTGNRHIRYDTYQGALDITFLRLTRSDGQLLSFGLGIRDALQADVVAAGFRDPKKIYAVFYGGGSPRFGVQIPCGQGGSPGAMGAIYLACLLERTDIQTLIPVHGLPKILGLGIIHEVFHNLGAVPACAPHAAASHASDDTRDIMVASLSTQLSTYRDAGFLPMLDVGRDDYYGHANVSCLDIAKSTFIEPPAKAPAADHFFNVAGQLTTTVMGDVGAPAAGWLIRNRWPLAETTYWFLEKPGFS